MDDRLAGSSRAAWMASGSRSRRIRSTSSAGRVSSPLECGPKRQVCRIRARGADCWRTSSSSGQAAAAICSTSLLSDLPGRNAERLEASEQAAGHGQLDRCGLGDAVVLQHEQDRRSPQGGHVQRLVYHPLAQRAVSQEGDGHCLAAFQLFCQRHTRCDRHDPALHAVRVKIAASAGAASRRARRTRRLPCPSARRTGRAATPP